MDPEKEEKPEADESWRDTFAGSLDHWLEVLLANQFPVKVPIIGGARYKTIMLVVSFFGMLACHAGFALHDIPYLHGFMIGMSSAAPAPAPTPSAGVAP